MQIKIKGGDGKEILLKLVKKIWQCQAHSPLHLNLFEGQAVLGVVTRDSNKFLTFGAADGFVVDEASALRGIAAVKSTFWLYSSTQKKAKPINILSGYNFQLSKKYLM